MRIGLAHTTIRVGDAVGNDILGQYRALASAGHSPVLVAQHFGLDAGAPFERIDLGRDPSSLKGLDALVHHHSFYWPQGAEIVADFRGPVAFKYHNITPPRFFLRFGREFIDGCTRGREQTGILARCRPEAMWMCDSAFNQGEILALGVVPWRTAVVPPFSRVDALLRLPPQRRDPSHWLFVGRWAPNKGHPELVECFAKYRFHYAPGARLTIVGDLHELMGPYSAEVWDIVAAHGVQAAADFRTHVGDGELAGLFATAGCYVNMSRHEGFCVPLIEAQSVGMPVLTSACGASGETAGEGQPVVPMPGDDEGFHYVARVAHEVASNEGLRAAVVRAGRANVERRFTDTVVAAAFFAAMAPVLEGRSP